MESVDIQLRPVFTAGSRNQFQPTSPYTKSCSDFYHNSRFKKRPTNPLYGNCYSSSGASRKELVSKKAVGDNKVAQPKPVFHHSHGTPELVLNGAGSPDSSTEEHHRRREKQRNNLSPRFRNEITRRQSNKHGDSSTPPHKAVTVQETEKKGILKQVEEPFQNATSPECLTPKVEEQQPITPTRESQSAAPNESQLNTPRESQSATPKDSQSTAPREVDSILTWSQKQIDKSSSSDSGMYSSDCISWLAEDLSSCCESNDVFDEHPHMEPTQVIGEDLSVSEMKTSHDSTLISCTDTLCSGERQEPILNPPSLSRCSSTSCVGEVDEDIYEDALSYFVSAFSSTASSAYVTPASTRSSSPAPASTRSSSPAPEYHTGNTIAALATLDEALASLDEAQKSLDQLTDSSSIPCTFSFVDLLDKPAGSEAVPDSGVSRHGSFATNGSVFVGDVEIELDSCQYHNATFELIPSCPIVYDEEHDSGCGISVGSPSKSSHGTKSKTKIVLSPHTLGFSIRKNSDSLQIPTGESFEFSSLSTASPKSSVCSHTSSPISLSPSPVSPMSSTNDSLTKIIGGPLSSQDRELTDLKSHNPVPHPHVCSGVQPILSHMPGPHSYMNGVISMTTQSPRAPSEHHQPTPEEILSVKQWHTNLMSQLRQQQEKLDQKKKEKQLSQQVFFTPHLPEHLDQSLPRPHHPSVFPGHGLPAPVHLQDSLAYNQIPPCDSLSHPFPPPPPPFLTPAHSPPIYGGPPPNGLPPPIPCNSSPRHRVLMPPQGPDFHSFPPHNPPPCTHGNYPTDLNDFHERVLKPHSETPLPRPLPCVARTRMPHPLCDKWVMWYDKITSSHRNSYSNYKASLTNLSTITSVEDFWKLLNNIRPPSLLEGSANYHFFKQGINPLWEDPANSQGGKWVLTIKDNPTVVDRVWIEVLLMLIGGCTNKRNLVNGVVVSRRKKGDRVAIWTGHKAKGHNIEICKDLIGALLLACQVSRNKIPAFVKQLFEFKSGLGLVFMHNTDSLKSGSSYQNESHIKLQDHLGSILRGLGC